MKRTELCPWCNRPLVWKGRRAWVWECDSGGDWNGIKQSLICHLQTRISSKR